MSTTLMSQTCSDRSVGKFSAALTCRGRRWGRGGSGWGDRGRLLVLLFALLVTLWLLGGAGVLWLFVFLLVLLLLFFLAGRSPHPAQQPCSQGANSKW